jgi:hypothetical protein
VPDNVTAPVHRFLSEGMSIDQVIAELKRIGFTIELTAEALSRVTALTRDDAEQRVRRHPAWQAQNE